MAELENVSNRDTFFVLRFILHTKQHHFKELKAIDPEEKLFEENDK